MSQFQRICAGEAVPPGQGRMFVINDAQIAVFNVAGEYFALANECPHAGASLANGDIDGDCVSCRIHHWQFSIRDGTYLDEDKPRYNARTYETRVVGDEVQVKFHA